MMSDLPEISDEKAAKRYFMQENDRLRAEVAELRKDAERMNWMASHPQEATVRLDNGNIKACVFYGMTGSPKWTMREMIDRAIASEAKGE